jgi:hypothetical protein
MIEGRLVILLEAIVATLKVESLLILETHVSGETREPLSGHDFSLSELIA